MTGNKDNPTDNDTPESTLPETVAEDAAVDETIEPQDNTDDTPETSEPDTSPEENTEEQIDKKEDPQNTESEVANNHPPEKKSSAKGFLFLLLLILLLIIGLGVAAYYGWQEYQKQTLRIQTLEGNAAEQTVSNQALEQKISSEQAQWANQQQQQFQSLQEAQGLLQQRLDSHSTRIQGLAGTSRQDWLLAEVRYLLRLANQRLLVEQNTLGAQGLLEAADKILRSIDDNGLLPVRDAVAKEMIALKIVDTVDKEGLYLKISALKEQIQALPLIPFLNKDEDATTLELKASEDETPIGEKKWYQVMLDSAKSSLANVGNLIQIRKHDTAPELLISEQQQYQVVNHLTLMFEQAQYALLHEKKGIYRDSLSKAEAWWSTYYGHYNEHEAIKSEITHLKQQAITQTLPDISRSSRLITEYIEQFHQTDRNATAVNKPEDDKTEEAN